MNDDFTPETLREKAEFVTGVLGADDKATDAMVRLGVQMRAGTANQADFDAAQDAFDDAMGRPQHKHLHPVVWQIRHWWHWHITDPIIYPAIFAIEDAPRKLWWHVWRKRHGGMVLTFQHGEMTWHEFKQLKRELKQNAGGEQQ